MPYAVVNDLVPPPVVMTATTGTFATTQVQEKEMLHIIVSKVHLVQLQDKILRL